jgi:polyphenol oxidase
MDKDIIIPGIFLRQKVRAFFTTKFFDGTNILDAIPGADAFYLPIQKHTDKVLVVECDLESKIADAVVTNRPGLAIGVKTADCVPVLLYDPVVRVAGAVHAGWRGTAQAILKRTIEVFSDRFSSSPGDIVVVIGPSIRACCYQVGPEVIDGVTAATGSGDYVRIEGDSYYIDLQTANRLQALSAGIGISNIDIIDECTHCMPDRYYSYRFSKGAVGRQYAFIALAEN